MLVLAMRAALLDSRVYAEIDEEPQAMFRALGVVLAVAIASGLGLMNTEFQAIEDSPTRVLLVTASTVVLGWLLWGTVAYLIGTRLLGGRATHRMLLRSLGIAYAPGMLAVFASVPVGGGAVLMMVALWMLMSGMVAIRETQGYGWLRALVPAVVGWFVVLLFMLLFLGPSVSSGG